MARELCDIREEINRENEVILEAFLRRMALSREVAEYKRAKGLPVYDGKREEEILASMEAKTPEEFRASARELFETLMRLSREEQEK